MQYLRQSTASQSVLIGPFVADSDGVTAETALTINAADIRLSANGGNMTAKNSGGATHDEAGWYTTTLDATDTATVGRLQLSVAVSGALPVFAEFHVLEEAVYDALFAASATGLLPANVTQVAGQTASATGAIDFDDLATIEAKTSQLSFGTWGVEADLSGIEGSNIPVANLADDYDGTGYNKAASKIRANVIELNGDATAADYLTKSAGSMIFGTVGAGSTTTAVNTSALSTPAIDADQFVNRVVVFISEAGAAAGVLRQVTEITANTASATPTLTVAAVTQAPASGDTFIIL
jgi:hypothetical protein